MGELREITTHQCPGCRNVVIHADHSGPGGAPHVYVVALKQQAYRCGDEYRRECEIRFQRGSVRENGVNGITNEALLAIVEDRLLGFQSGQLACYENQVALVHVESALLWLKQRSMRVRGEREAAAKG